MACHVSPSLKRLMRRRDKLHARKDPRYKTIKHEVQKKLRAAYWQHVEEIIAPTNEEDSMGANKRLWGLFNLSPPNLTQGGTTSQTSGQLNNQCGW